MKILQLMQDQIVIFKIKQRDVILNWEFKLKVILFSFLVFFGALFLVHKTLDSQYIADQKLHYQNIAEQRSSLVDNYIQAKQEAISLLAITLGKKEELKTALQNQDYSGLSYESYVKDFTVHSRYKNVWIQVVNNAGVSVYRSWSTKTGDAVIKKRKDLQAFFENPKHTESISVGKYDLTFKSTVPVYANGDFLGVFEVLAKFNSIAEQLVENSIDTVILVSSDYTEQLTNPFTGRFLNDNYIANLDAKEQYLQFIIDNDLQSKKSESSYSVLPLNNTFVSYKTFYDTDNHELASFYLFENLQDVNSALQKPSNQIYIYITLLYLLFIVGYLWRATLSEKHVGGKEREALTNRNQVILNTLVDGVITINQKGIIETVNPSTMRLFGYSEDEMIGQNIKILMPAPYQDEHDGYLEKYAQTKERHIIGIGREVIGKRKDDSTFPMHLSIGEMLIDGETKYTGVIRDISAIVDSFNEAMQFKEALDNTLDMIFMFNPSDYRFIYANKGAVKSMEYSFDELMEIRAFDIKPEISESKFKEMVQPLIRGEKDALQFETVHRTKSGQDIPVAISLQLIRTNGDEGRFVAIVHDITERRKAENLKKEFVSTVSHELRTPLTSIKGSLALVLSKVQKQKLLPEKLEKMLSLAERNSTRLSLLINDILDLEKIESGKMLFDLKQESINQVAQRAVEDNKGYAKNHDVSIRLLPAAEQVNVDIDAHRIFQVFSNLISNAIKFSEAGSEVVVQIKSIDDKVKISVIDKGRGISEEFKKSIFQKFTQADSSDSREKGGTGLGLSISHAIIEAHKGTIGFESEIGVGTEFFFILNQSQNIEVEEIDDTLANGTVLICEDNKDIAAVYQQFLYDKKYNSVVVDSVEDARAAIASTDFNLMILDLKLKESNGIELLKDKDIAKALANIPVVVISGNIPNNLFSNKDIRLKVMDWSEKPINMERLAKNIDKIEGNFNNPIILHVEDDPDLLQLTSMLLESWTEYHSVTSLVEARQVLKELTPNLVLLDLGLKDGSGKDLIPQLKEQNIPIIVFTGEQPEKGYLPNTPDEVLIKSVTQNNDLINKIKEHLKIS